MTKEDFFEVLGELDDNIVKGDRTTMKKKLNWKVLGAAAACLALVCAAVVYFTNHDGDETVGEGIADIAPMVYVNDTLYKQSSDQQGYPEKKDEFVYLGEIESTAGGDIAPNQNFQSNSPIVGCEVYQYGEHIVVKINGAYWLYMKYGESEANWDDLTEQEKAQLDPTYQGG